MLKYVMSGIALVLALSVSQETYGQKYTGDTGSGVTVRALSEGQKVEQLIQFIQKMQGATFIRNGSEHTCQEAAEHLRSKWQKHQDKVKTAEGFIEELASRSGLSGQAYMIRLKDGREITTNEALTRELNRLEQQ
ncbi:MAG: DUF5329 domain-containing protein [Hymenobacteraceae bacterium]|nr:DUF5329 domain-containing protein [Hymenobacteraceae bacterium]